MNTRRSERTRQTQAATAAEPVNAKRHTSKPNHISGRGDTYDARRHHGHSSHGFSPVSQSRPGRPGSFEPLNTDTSAALAGLRQRYGLNPEFPAAVMEETRQLLANPGLDDPTLVDLTKDIPFVTIDNGPVAPRDPNDKENKDHYSLDLDQAVYIERKAGGGYTVYYALSDASYYVKPGSALFREALKRGVTYYLPGMNVPMLPHELSEGIISLNPGVDRRSLVFKISLDEKGEVEKTETMRAKIHSRAQLTYKGVQAFHDDPTTSPLKDQEYTSTLELFKEVGELRIANSSSRDVPHYHRWQARVGLDPSDPPKFVVEPDGRLPVDRWNEQISLLTNEEGAKLLPGVYKQHPEPQKERLEAAREVIDGIIRANHLPREQWEWRSSESQASYVERLPQDGPYARVSKAIERQLIRSNNPAYFSRMPGLHFGIGANPYSRFSAPMREVIGIVTHHLLLNPGKLSSSDVDAAIAIANLSKSIDGKLNHDIEKAAIDQLFSSDRAKPHGARPVRTGTVMSVSPSQVFVQLDDPAVEVKVPLSNLPAHYRLMQGGAGLRSDETPGNPSRSIIDGTEIRLKVADYDQSTGRWSFELVP